MQERAALSGGEALVYQQLFELLTSRIGVSLRSPRQLDHIQAFVASRLAELGLAEPGDYVELLADQTLRSREFSQLIAVVTNPHTFFFRDADQFAALRVLLQQTFGRERRALCVWSAGCATGEEPYSIAMLCADLGVEVQILASDVSSEWVELARRGDYRRWSMRNLPKSYLQRFTEVRGDACRVNAAIRRRVEFQLHNLVQEAMPVPRGPVRGWDLILCRNVLMYFDRSVTQEVTRGFSQVLAPTGWLLLSSTESLHGLEVPLAVEPIGRAFGYRPGRAAPRPQEADGPGAPPAPRPPRPAPTPAKATPPPPSSQQIVTLLDEGEQDKALAGLEALLELDPDEVRAWITLGNLRLKAHRFEDALTAYGEAQERAPLEAEVHYLQGVVFRKLNDLERAAHALRRALFLQPSFWCASFLLAGVHGRLGQHTQRRLNLEHSLAILDAGRDEQLFASYTVEMEDLELDRDEARRLCRRYLGR